MSQPLLNRCNARSQMTLDIPLRKVNTGQQASSFLSLKKCTKISHRPKNAKITAFFTHNLKKEILSKLCT